MRDYHLPGDQLSVSVTLFCRSLHKISRKHFPGHGHAKKIRVKFKNLEGFWVIAHAKIVMAAFREKQKYFLRWFQNAGKFARNEF